jgi:hypothetical protein
MKSQLIGSMTTSKLIIEWFVTINKILVESLLKLIMMRVWGTKVEMNYYKILPIMEIIRLLL